MEILKLLALTIWLMLPAYTPNNFAVLVGGGKPIDLGRKFVDGRRILGDGKTFRGFMGGISGGLLTGIVQYGIEKLSGFVYYSSFGLPEILGFFIIFSTGALAGDILGSFVKRRLAIERGGPFPVVDQLDFVFGAFLMSYMIMPGVFLSLFQRDVILTAIIITPVLHILVNFLAYKIGKKDVPW